MGTGKAPAGHSQCLGLTFQVRLLSSEETDHSLQLAELPVVGIDVCDAVNPGGKGRRNPKGQRETTVRQMLLDDNNCKKEISKKLWSEKSLPILLCVVSTLKSNSVAVSQTPALNPTPINLPTVLSRALQHELTMQQSCSKSCQHFPVLCKVCPCACTDNNSVMERPDKQRVMCNVRPEQEQKKNKRQRNKV